jgi:hypothetical protein
MAALTLEQIVEGLLALTEPALEREEAERRWGKVLYERKSGDTVDVGNGRIELRILQRHTEDDELIDREAQLVVTLSNFEEELRCFTFDEEDRLALVKACDKFTQLGNSTDTANLRSVSFETRHGLTIRATALTKPPESTSFNPQGATKPRRVWVTATIADLVTVDLIGHPLDPLKDMLNRFDPTRT